MKMRNISARFTFWLAVPLFAAVFFWGFVRVTSWMHKREAYPYVGLSAPSGVPYQAGPEMDQRLYRTFRNLYASSDTITVGIVVDGSGKILFRDHIGYELIKKRKDYLFDGYSIGDTVRFLVLDGFDRDTLIEICNLAYSPIEIHAKGRDDGFYFYPASLEIRCPGQTLRFSLPDVPQTGSLSLRESDDYMISLVEPTFSKTPSSEKETRESWDLLLEILDSIPDCPVLSREDAFARPDRASLFGPYIWQEITEDRDYRDFFTNTGVHVYTRVFEHPLKHSLELTRDERIAVLTVSVLLLFGVYHLSEALIGRPLRRAVHETAHVVSAETHFEAAELTRQDEFGELSRALKKAEEAFQEKWDTERALERKRQDFVAAASHDLKTPLALIGGYVEAVQQGIDPEENARYLDSIEREAGKMNRLVLEMLDYTRLDRMEELEHGKRENLAELLDSWLSEAAPLFDGRTLERALPKQLFVRCDAALLRRAVDNLFSNAAKFTPKGGNVRVSLGTRPSDGAFFSNARFLLTVENDGEHIPETDLGRIFEMFYRTDRARTRGSSGSGVGLAVAKRICELHGFTLRAENTAAGVRFLLEG